MGIKVQSRRSGSALSLNAGFTLIEIMVVVMIIGLLVGIVGPRVLGQADKASVTAAKVQMDGLAGALDMYRLDNNFYPTTDQGLEALITKPSGSPVPKDWNPEGYFSGKTIPTDPWGQEYIYFSPGEDEAYDILSLGRDRQEGGEGFDADISVWD